MGLFRLEIRVTVVRGVEVAQGSRIEGRRVARNGLEARAQFAAVAEIAGVLAAVAVDRVVPEIQLDFIAAEIAIHACENSLGVALFVRDGAGDRMKVLALKLQARGRRPALAQLHHIAPKRLLHPGTVSAAVGVGAEVLGGIGGALLRHAEVRLPSRRQLVVAEQLIKILRRAAEIGVGRAGVGAIAVVAGAALAAEGAQAQRLSGRQRLHDGAVHGRVAIAVAVRIGIAELRGVDGADPMGGRAADAGLQCRLVDLLTGVGRHRGGVAAARRHRDRGFGLFAACACGDEHHAANRAGTIDGRDIAADDLHALNLIGREVVEVGRARGVLRVHRHAVEQHQHIGTAEPAHKDIAGLPGAAIGRHLHASDLLQQSDQVLCAALLDLLAGDDADAGQGMRQRLRIARSRYHHRR